MALIDCSECSRQVSDKAASCPNCGAPITGTANRSNAAPVSQQVHVVQVGKSRSLAVLLALLLGGLGAHKFYLNRPGWGVLYLLFCWTFIPLLIALLEGLMYLTLDDAQFQAKYSGRA